MDELEDLLRIASLYNIRVIYRNLHVSNPVLEGYAKPLQRLIVLDNSLLGRPTDHICVLAEEIGHIFYPPVYSCVNYHRADFYQKDTLARSEIKYQHSKTERVALVWATGYLIPDEEFWEFAASGPREFVEWLEHFGVAEWLMRWKIGFMKTQTHFKCRNIIKREPPKGGF